MESTVEDVLAWIKRQQDDGRGHDACYLAFVWEIEKPHDVGDNPRSPSRPETSLSHLGIICGRLEPQRYTRYLDILMPPSNSPYLNTLELGTRNWDLKKRQGSGHGAGFPSPSAP
ncbi:hypothetical protein N7457_009777 [Penicillium paradoxum]|uniref:uncharacterized protein n=1 Tax=Penicillium paradoxum TaxID=176176 RepID=UPI00254884C3|nr:uncharacterized protein N7457_009777 [Penicillium paradoxum]KAJ5774881.1 hypothetical protein N7457_009777 [Penicillium paradoxum]